MATPQKTVLITGCTPGGIGHSLALTLSRPPYSYQVFATARTTSSLAALADIPNITPLELDVNDSASIAQLKSTIAAATSGRLDYLINNAGRNYTVPALEVDPAEAKAVFATNVVAVMELCTAFAPLLISTARSTPAPSLPARALSLVNSLTLGFFPFGSASPRPAIIQIGSLAALMPYAFGSVYNASKAALHSYSDTLRLELAPFGVDVVTIVTGGVRSNIARVERHLRSDSLYSAIENYYESRQTHSQLVGIESRLYAERVAKQVTKRNRADRLWEGGKIGMAWFAITFLPRSVLAQWMAREFGLAKLARLQRRKVR
ncbi:NAD(P)-binding protein [Myriangium duriaei CBS 260.36]|uniref:NAD(P)-binding protein n=1 Tax=Myriangium duriaei CBS 260.36 TaxID=1168546 RepID=A0A9P4JAL7_9PEZI|nr:NAD(P)-binding protein [Myriangium duriaei CBS 260.36]